jgi:hypothetical protein
MEIVWRLLDHIVTATYQSLPAEALASSKRPMRDTLGAALAAPVPHQRCRGRDIARRPRRDVAEHGLNILTAASGSVRVASMPISDARLGRLIRMIGRLTREVHPHPPPRG